MKAGELGVRRGLGKSFGWALGMSVIALPALSARATILLNDTWADGNRTSTGLPTDSPVLIGQSAANGSNSVSPGSLNFTLPTNSLKAWTYFTSDSSAPDGNQPHNSVTTMGAVGDKMTASVDFTLPNGATAVSTSKNFRVGLFHDPTDARVQVDTNSDGGGGTAPWTDALGYVVMIPLNSATTNANPIQLGKRSASNSSLAGSTGAYTLAPTGGTAYSLLPNTTYTVKLQLEIISPTQLDVTASVMQGATTLATHTASDTGVAFGGTALVGALPGSNVFYTKFDQLFFRNSDNTQATDLNFTNFLIDAQLIPEPASATALLALGGLMLRRRRTV